MPKWLYIDKAYWWYPRSSKSLLPVRTPHKPFNAPRDNCPCAFCAEALEEMNKENTRD